MVLVAIVTGGLALAACSSGSPAPSAGQRKAVAGILGGGSAPTNPGAGRGHSATNSPTTSSVSSTSAAPSGSQTTTTTAPSPTTQPASSPSKGSALTQFGDGTWVVGSGAHTVAPGTYFTKGVGDTCRWERTAPDRTVLGTEFVLGPAVATIASSDAGFISTGCGRWKLEKHGPEVTRFSDGDYAVGVENVPGQYVTTGGVSCSWREARDFSGSPGAIIGQQSGSMGNVIVDLEPPIAEFHTTSCGTWTLKG